MIQVYSQKEDIIPVEDEGYFIDEGRVAGLNYETRKLDDGLHVTVKGTCAAESGYYYWISIVKDYMIWEGIDFIKIAASIESRKKNVSFALRYMDKNGKAWVDLMDEGEKEAVYSNAREMQWFEPVVTVQGGNTVDAEFVVKIYYGKNPAKTPGEYLEKNGNVTIVPTEAYIHTVLNGPWEAHLEHPIDSEGRWKYLVEDNVVKMPYFNGEQLFRIKRKEKRDSGIFCDMEPIFYDAMGDCWLEDVRPIKKSGQQALNMMLAPNSKYSGKSDITKISTAYYQYRNFLEALNGDDENSFINRWGGEILFDNFEVIVNKRVGGDYGVELRYGKNIPEDGLTEEIDTGGVVTRIYPKSYNGHTMKNNGHVDSPLIGNYPIVKTATITFDDVKMVEDAQENDADNGVIVCKNQTELDAALIKRCQEQFEAGLDKPKISIEADMILLQNTELYKDYKALEEVGFGDTIHCRHSRLDITTDARVIEMKYNSIRKCVESVVLGDFQYNFFNDVSSVVNRIDGAIRPDGSVIAEKIAGLLDGAMTSLRAQYNVAKKQDVIAILFENLDKDSKLYGALALGTQGIMISKKRTADGRDWDWTTALTANGLVATIIVAGILSDKTGKNYWDLDNGILHVGNGDILGARITAGGRNNGNGTIVVKDENENTICVLDVDGVFATKGKYSGTVTGGKVIGSTIESSELLSVGESAGLQLTDGRIKFVSSSGEDGAQISGVSNYNSNLELISYEMNIRINTDEGFLRLYGPSAYISISDYIRNEGDTELAGETTCWRDFEVQAGRNAFITGNLRVGGEKSRVADTEDYDKRILYCYESSYPMFGDVGSGKTDRNGISYISVYDIFRQTITGDYHVFLQSHGNGAMWVEEMHPNYFVVRGEPDTSFSWEIKSLQKGYENRFLEDYELTYNFEKNLSGYEKELREMKNTLSRSVMDYQKEMEKMLNVSIVRGIGGKGHEN